MEKEEEAVVSSVLGKTPRLLVQEGEESVREREEEREGEEERQVFNRRREGHEVRGLCSWELKSVMR